MQEQTAELIEPIWVRPKTGARMIDCGVTRFYELLNAGTFKTKKIGGMRLVSVASIKALGNDDE